MGLGRYSACRLVCKITHQAVVLVCHMLPCTWTTAFHEWFKFSNYSLSLREKINLSNDLWKLPFETLLNLFSLLKQIFSVLMWFSVNKILSCSDVILFTFWPRMGCMEDVLFSDQPSGDLHNLTSSSLLLLFQTKNRVNTEWEMQGGRNKHMTMLQRPQTQESPFKQQKYVDWNIFSKALGKTKGKKMKTFFTKAAVKAKI